MPTFGSQLNIMVDPEKRDKVKRKARGQGLTVNELINKLLDQWLLDQWGESQDDESLTPIIEKVIGDRLSLHSRLLQEIQSELISQRDRLSRLESLASPPNGGDEIADTSPLENWEDVRPDDLAVQNLTDEPIESNPEPEPMPILEALRSFEVFNLDKDLTQPTTNEPEIIKVNPPDVWLDGNGIRIKLNEDIRFAPKDWKKGNIVLIRTFNPFRKLFSKGFAVGDGDYTTRASIDQVDEIYVDWSFKLHNKDYPQNHPGYPQYLRDLGVPIFNWDREQVLGDFDPDLLADPTKPTPTEPIESNPEPDSTVEETVIKINSNIPVEELETLKKGLTGLELTKRLGYKNDASLRGLKTDEDLARITQQKDPHGIPWRRTKNDGKTRKVGQKGYIYYPIIP